MGEEEQEAVAEAAEAGLGALGTLGGRSSRPPRIGAPSKAPLRKPRPDPCIVGLMAGL